MLCVCTSSFCIHLTNRAAAKCSKVTNSPRFVGGQFGEVFVSTFVCKQVYADLQWNKILTKQTSKTKLLEYQRILKQIFLTLTV